MGGTLSCDVCERVIECSNPDTSEYVHTLRGGEKHGHVCCTCYNKEPSKYSAHVKELGYEIWHSAFRRDMEGPLGESLEKAAEAWKKCEYRACKHCPAETAIHPDTVACFACKTPF